MRALLATCLLGACATASTLSPPERLLGCWIDRDAGAATMRWFVDQGGGLRGVHLVHKHASEPERTLFSLETRGAGHAFCQLDAEGRAATQCWQVAEGEGGSLEGGRAFIDRYGDRLRIAVVSGGPERVVFFGRQDGCD